MVYFFEHHALNDKGFFWVNDMYAESFPAHIHIAYELIFVRKGMLRLQVEQETYQLSAGNMAFIFCNQIHGFKCNSDTELTVVVFAPELIGDFHAAYQDHIPKSNVILLSAPPRFNGLSTVYAQKSLLYSACDMLLSSTEMEPVGNLPHISLLRNVFAYIDKHFGGDCSLKSLAGELQYDYAYISKLFTKHTGMHFTEYLNNYRISQACYLLDGCKHTVSEIAERCGYGTLRSFHRNFRQIMNTSPREYLTASAR